MAKGLDYAFYPHPGVHAIKAYGAEWVGRYVSSLAVNDTNGKNLIRSERDALLDAGRREEARDWFGKAAAADSDGQTDAAERFDDLDEFMFDDLEGTDEADEAGQDDEHGSADEPGERVAVSESGGPRLNDS